MLLTVLNWNDCVMCDWCAVYVGRQVMSLWVKGGRVHELYTAGCGLYACWLSLRLLILLSHWLPQGWHFIVTKMKSWTILVSIISKSKFHEQPAFTCFTYRM